MRADTHTETVALEYANATFDKVVFARTAGVEPEARTPAAHAHSSQKEEGTTTSLCLECALKKAVAGDRSGPCRTICDSAKLVAADIRQP
eukprot:scaffold181335_cov43-Prasinocladus_malaysianus.AAC.1